MIHHFVVWIRKYKNFLNAVSLFLISVFVLINFPNFFKQELKKTLLKEIDNKLNGKFSFSEVSTSSLKHFPHITLTFHHPVLMSYAIQKNDTVLSAENIQIAFDFNSLIKGDKVEVKKIVFHHPVVRLKVDSLGRANYMMVKEDKDSAVAESDSSSFELKMDQWKITEGKIEYVDKKEDVSFRCKNFNHLGSGDFKKDISDLFLYLDVGEVFLAKQNLIYINKKSFFADLNLEMNSLENKFTFKDHKLRIDHFNFGFDGFIKIPSTGPELDLTLKIKEATFRDFLSLLPVFYKHEFDHIDTDAQFSMNASVRGKLSEKTMPLFKVELNIKDGHVKYKKLPQSFKNIELKLLVENKYPIKDSINIRLDMFKMTMGDNPVHGHCYIRGIDEMQIDALMNGDINLADITNFYPVNDFTLDGKLKSDIRINGVYNSVTKKMPTINAKLQVINATLKDTLVGMPFQNINIQAEVVNEGDQYKHTKIDLKEFSFVLGPDKFNIKGKIFDLEKINFDLFVDGSIDIAKSKTLFSIPKKNISGFVKTHFEAKGNIEDLKNKKYESLYADGWLTLTNIKYIDSSRSLKPIYIPTALLDFNHDKITLKSMFLKTGRTDLRLKGELYDYFAMLHSDTADLIKAKLTLKSDSIYLKDFEAQKAEQVSEKDTSVQSESIIQIPENIDFVFDASIKYIRYNTTEIKNLKGEVVLRNGCLKLNKSEIELAGSKIDVDASYDPIDHEKASFQLNLDIVKMDIQRAVKDIELLSQLAPSASGVKGVFDVHFLFKGFLNKQMNIEMNTLYAKGNVAIENGEVKGIKVLKQVSKMTKKHNFDENNIKGVNVFVEIKNKKLRVRPFDFQIGKFKLTLEGEQTFDSDLNYILYIHVLKKIKIPVHVTGTSSDPKIKVGKGHEEFNWEEVE